MSSNYRNLAKPRVAALPHCSDQKLPFAAHRSFRIFSTSWSAWAPAIRMHTESSPRSPWEL